MSNFEEGINQLKEVLKSVAVFLESQSYPLLNNFFVVLDGTKIANPNQPHCASYEFESWFKETENEDSADFLKKEINFTTEYIKDVGQATIYQILGIVAATVYFCENHGYRAQGQLLRDAVAEYNPIATCGSSIETEILYG